MWEIRCMTVQLRKEFGELQRADALWLCMYVKCRRNRIRIEGYGLVGDRDRPLRGGQAGGDAYHTTLEEGQEAWSSFVSDEVALYHRRNPIHEACWWDAEGKAHCQRIDSDVLQSVLADSRL